ncbi:MAG: hypothetical protein Q8Q09_11220 [Deltaproteobacteria bacterium]|nr:hypothetical protein [Deltaproteobacteria bacterium]
MKPQSHTIQRATALLIACASLVRCAPTAPGPDVMADGAVDATASDGSVSDATIGDAAPCADLSGAYSVQTVCGTEMSASQYCIAQTGCAITIHILNGETVRGTVSGNTGRVMVTSTDGDGGVAMEDCTFTVEGGRITERCDNVVLGVRERCDSNLTRLSNDRATSYCCDPGVANSCGAGQRCNFAVPAGSASGDLTFTACMPNGTIAEGMPCTRVAGVIGSDSCVAGTTCVNLGQPTPAMRTCQRTCASNEGCRAGEVCRRFGYAPNAGVCTPTCTLGGTSCPAGNTCRTYVTVPASRMPIDQIRTTCNQTGTTPNGARCMDALECGPNADCFFDPLVAGTPMPICRQTCSPTFACPAGQTCRPRRAVGPENPDGLGGCYAS